MTAAVAEISSSSSEARRIGASGIGIPLANHGRDVEVTVPILVGEPRRQSVLLCFDRECGIAIPRVGATVRMSRESP